MTRIFLSRVLGDLHEKKIRRVVSERLSRKTRLNSEAKMFSAAFWVACLNIFVNMYLQRGCREKRGWIMTLKFFERILDHLLKKISKDFITEKPFGETWLSSVAKIFKTRSGPPA